MFSLPRNSGIILRLYKNVLKLKENLTDPDFECKEDEIQYQNHVKESTKVYELYKDKSFSFIFKNDKRGSKYSQGHHINPNKY